MIVTTASILSILMALILGLSLLYIDPFIVFILAFMFSPLFFKDYLVPQLNKKEILKKNINAHRQYDLSHTFFPVAYYSNEEVTAAQTQNKDHAAFLERIRSVIDRAVAFGESSHNQRT